MANGNTMTVAEVHAECSALAQLVGPRADISAHIFAGSMERRAEVSISLYPSGVSRGREFHASGTNWSELFAELRAKWLAHAEEHRRQTIRAMAMKIIEITADQGACTDAALRQHFQVGDVEDLGALAVEDANEISSRGPFSITSQGGANRQPGDDEEQA